MNIRKLTLKDEEAFIKAYHEFKASNDFDFVSRYKKGMAFSELIDFFEDQENGRNLPEGYVPSTFRFGFLKNKLVGRVMIRHQLNDFLRRIGGHIGYGVVPSERGKGFGTQLLNEGLSIARKLGLERVLLTCDEDNLHSQKIIENGGGIFDGFADEATYKPRKCRYRFILAIARISPIPL